MHKDFCHADKEDPRTVGSLNIERLDVFHMKLASYLDNLLYERLIEESRGSDESPARAVLVLNNSL